MVNLTIRLGKAGVGTGAIPGGKQEQAGGTIPKGPSVPLHLVGTDLPHLKGVGTVFSEPCAMNFVGMKAHRKPGDKVHICVRCNFPIAVYGRLIPCEHAFCLTCAKLDPTCFLCEERVTRIQKMDVLEGIYICGAPGCLRSFLARPDFDLHISDAHSQLLQLEQGRLSPERNSSAANSVSETQVQSQHSDVAPPVRQPSGTLQVILPRKESQRKPPKGVRQDPLGLTARPVPDLRLPEEFPHHRTNLSKDGNTQGNDQNLPRYREREMHAPQGHGENERQSQEAESLRERRLDGGPLNHSGLRKERESEKGEKGAPPPPPPPPSFPPPKESHKQEQQSIQHLPPPPPYPPPSFPPAYLPQQEGNSFPSRFEVVRSFHSGTPYENGQQLRHPNGSIRPPEGYGQGGHRSMNGSNQEQFSQNRPIRPHFHSEYGPPMGMASMSHLPPPPGPPGSHPKRPKFNDQGMDYSWGLGTPGSFAGLPPGYGYPNWMPPANP